MSAYFGSQQHLVCPDCKGKDIVEDHAQGDMVCRGCGLVVESHIIDERSEWRTFSDKDKESADPNRVGGPVNHLLGDGGMGTTIARMPNDGGLSFQLARTQARTNTRDRPIQEAQRQIHDICNRLGLGESNIPTVAADIYHRAVQTDLLKGRTVLAICCACIYKACAEHAGSRRTFKEILAVVPGIKTGEVGRCFQIIHKHSQEQAQEKGGAAQVTAAQFMHPADHVRKDASRLAMPNEAISAATRAAELAQPRGSPQDNPRDHVWPGHMAWQGKAPKSIEAGVLYIIAQLWAIKGHKAVALKEVVAVTGVSDSTIKQVYQQMWPHLRKLVEPKWATEAELAQMPPPPADKKAVAAAKAAAAEAAAAAAVKPEFGVKSEPKQ